jgi:hypothetical protein
MTAITNFIDFLPCCVELQPWRPGKATRSLASHDTEAMVHRIKWRAKLSFGHRTLILPDYIAKLGLKR